jgi:hypothetical protein
MCHTKEASINLDAGYFTLNNKRNFQAKSDMKFTEFIQELQEIKIY